MVSRLHLPVRLPGALAAALPLAFGGCAEASEEAPAARIVRPAAGEAAPGTDVNVVLEAEGIRIAPASDQVPGTAHHHLFVDRDVTPPADTIPSGVTGIIHLGRGQTEFTLRALAPGEHRVIAVLADPWHVPVAGAAADTVHFEVRPADAP